MIVGPVRTFGDNLHALAARVGSFLEPEFRQSRLPGGLIWWVCLGTAWGRLILLREHFHPTAFRSRRTRCPFS